MTYEIVSNESRLYPNLKFQMTATLHTDVEETDLDDLTIVFPAGITAISTDTGTIANNTVTAKIVSMEADETITIIIQCKTGTTRGTLEVATDMGTTIRDVTNFVVYSCAYVGYFPQDLEKIGDKYPACLIQFGDSLKEPLHGNVKDVTQEVILYVYSNINQKNVSLDQITLIENIVNDIKEELLADFTLSGTIQCILDIGTERGGLLENFDYQTAGYTANMNLTKIYVNTKYREE